MQRAVSQRLKLSAVVGLALGLVGPARAAQADNSEGSGGEPASAREILAAAFSNLYEVDTAAGVELVMRNAVGHERRRRFQTVSKIVENRTHSIGRLIWPEYLRGMTVMMIEAENRSYDAFVYMPSLRKVRRITMAQRGDAFLGSDLTYEDFERRRLEDYELIEMREVEYEDAGREPAYLIRARPLREFNYVEIDFVVARSDGAMLAIRYFKRGASAPYRVMVAPRETMMQSNGHVLPTQLTVRNFARGTSTEVVFTDLRVNPEIENSVFSVGTLESQRDLRRPIE